VAKKKRKLPPALKAWSSCVKELHMNPQLLKKASNKKKLRACAEKKLRAMKR
jgi:hypothetical protein